MALTACGVTGGGGDDDAVPRENTAASLTLLEGRFHGDYGNGAIGALPGGDVVLAALLADDKGYTSDLAVIRLDPSMKPKWAVRIDEKSLASQVLAGPDGAVFVLAGEPGALRVLRLEGEDGTVERAVEYSDLAPGRALVLDDGGLLLATGNLARVDARLTLMWAKTIPAEHVVAAGDGFVAAGVPLGMGGRMSGIGLTKVSAQGTVAWKSFASPGPGQHSLAGLRVLSDGSLLVGLGNSSTRGDNVASLSPFALTKFDAQGRLQKMSRADLSQQVQTPTGNSEAPLQFGSGHSLVPMGEETWVSFVANSGALGHDVRRQVLARFGADGSFRDARYAGLHVAPGPEGSTFSFTLSGPALSLLQVFPAGTGCVKEPTRAAFSTVEGKTEYTEGASVQVSDLRPVMRSLVRTATPLSASAAPGCAAP